MKAHVYKVECLTNLHVGNGDINYSVVDKEVELDLVLGTPSIYSSGVKGALRDYFEELAKGGNKAVEAIINEVFGDTKTKSKGSYKFLSADLIARPMRVSDGKGSYVNTTTGEIVSHCKVLLESIDKTTYDEIFKGVDTETLPALNGKQFITAADADGIEGEPAVKLAKNSLLAMLAGDNWAFTTPEKFKEIKLPVLARNVLDDGGKSENLWYEEVVPHKSVFMLTIITPGVENKLDAYLDGAVVQFGGNASIGYGLTKITHFKSDKDGEPVE